MWKGNYFYTITIYACYLSLATRQSAYRRLQYQQQAPVSGKQQKSLRTRMERDTSWV